MARTKKVEFEKEENIIEPGDKGLNEERDSNIEMARNLFRQQLDEDICRE
jgi:hypothetical protein